MNEHNTAVSKGIEVAIQRLEAVERELASDAEKIIWETGRGDFLADGRQMGAQICIEALKRLLEANK